MSRADGVGEPCAARSGEARPRRESRATHATGAPPHVTPAPGSGPHTTEATDATAPPPPVQAEGVGVILDQTEILRDVSLTLHDGEVLALLGANGSGKSTLVRALLGILPSSGTIRLFGQPLGRKVPWRRIGYVPQRHAAGSGVPASALEVVTSGLLDSRRLRPPRDAKDRALRALEQMGVADLARRNVAELSGGQAQRVLLARALVREPDLLLLDEPTTGVDLHTQDALVEAIEAVPHASAIVILHEVGPFAPLLDRALILAGGRIEQERSRPFPPNGHRHVDPHPDPEPRPLTPGVGRELP